jgi:hypothetical protein
MLKNLPGMLPGFFISSWKFQEEKKNPGSIPGRKKNPGRIPGRIPGKNPSTGINLPSIKFNSLF